MSRDYSCLQLDRLVLRHLRQPLAASVQETATPSSTQQQTNQQLPQQQLQHELPQHQQPKQHKEQLLSDLVAGMVSGGGSAHTQPEGCRTATWPVVPVTRGTALLFHAFDTSTPPAFGHQDYGFVALT